MGCYSQTVVILFLLATFIHVSVNSKEIAKEKECTADFARRIQCGSEKLAKDECDLRGCCFDELQNQCFFPENSQCAFDPSKRFDCGWSGITQSECEFKKCCWDPDFVGSIPMCYLPRTFHRPVPVAGALTFSYILFVFAYILFLVGYWYVVEKKKPHAR